MLMGDFNLTVDNKKQKNIDIFMSTFDLECLIQKPACFQSSPPDCIYLILTN